MFFISCGSFTMSDGAFRPTVGMRRVYVIFHSTAMELNFSQLHLIDLLSSGTRRLARSRGNSPIKKSRIVWCLIQMRIREIYV